jgi:hypothetical protein
MMNAGMLMQVASASMPMPSYLLAKYICAADAAFRAE